MSEEKEDTKSAGSSVDSTINAVTGLVKEVPIYQDAIHPLAVETGKALQTVGRAVNAALLPIKGLVWGFEQIESFIQTKVSKKLSNTPIENIQAPDILIAGPALEALRYSGHKDSLADLYANLLASSMDKETAYRAHPSFVEIIKNISSDEAKVISFAFSNQSIPIIDIRRKRKSEEGSVIFSEYVSFIGFDAKCEYPRLVSSYLINLARLGLIELDKGSYLTAPTTYDRILNDGAVKQTIASINSNEQYTAEIVKYFSKLTPLGKQFGEACIVSKA